MLKLTLVSVEQGRKVKLTESYTHWALFLKLKGRHSTNLCVIRLGVLCWRGWYARTNSGDSCPESPTFWQLLSKSVHLSFSAYLPLKTSLLGTTVGWHCEVAIKCCCCQLVGECRVGQKMVNNLALLMSRYTSSLTSGINNITCIYLEKMWETNSKHLWAKHQKSRVYNRKQESKYMTSSQLRQKDNLEV